MYSMISKVNLFNRILLLVTMIVVVLFSRNTFLIGFIMGLTLLISIAVSKNFAFVFIAISGILIFLNYNYLFDIISRLSLSIGIIILFIYLLDIRQLHHLLERIFYKNKKRGKFLIKLKYNKLVRSRNKAMYYEQIKKNNDELSPKYVDKMVEFRTKKDIDDIYLYSRLRFYNYFSRRRYSNNNWTILDFIFLLFSIIIMVIFVIWRRCYAI